MREEMNAPQEAGREIDIQEMIFNYLHHWWVIAVCAIAFFAMALAYTNLFITPQYRASVKVYVNNSVSTSSVEAIASADLSVSQRLVKTYVNIIRSDTVLQKVSEEKNLPYAAAQLRGMITASQVDNTEIFDVYVTHPDPKMAAEIANAIADVAPGEIAGFVEGSSTKIIDYAKVPTAPFTPNYVNNALIGLAIGAVLAVVYLTIRYLLDVRILDAEDLENMFEYPVLGQVPDIAQADSRTRGAYAKYAQSTESTKKDQ